MKKKAIISVVSMQNGDEKEKIEVVTPGDFYKKESCYYAIYDETEISGMKGTTTTIKIFPDKIMLIRMGTTSSKMTFKNGVRDLNLYNTPYGTLELEIFTKELNINVDDDGGNIAINYDMLVSGKEMYDTLLQVNIKAQ